MKTPVDAAASPPVLIRRADYAPSPVQVDSVWLEFDL